MNRKLIYLILLLFSGIVNLNAAGQGSWFRMAQLRFKGDWDPYPQSYSQIYRYLSNTTSIRVMDERLVVSPGDSELFSCGFLVLTGRGGYPEFSEQQIENIRRYITGGGVLLIDTCSDELFERSADRTLNRVFPGKSYSRVPLDHAIYRSFYLIDYVSGLNMSKPFLECIYDGERIAVIKSHNDLFGVWIRDRMGNWLYEPQPGKFGQRKEAIKLTLNIFIYSVCGTYKNDPVHKPHIDRKLGR